MYPNGQQVYQALQNCEIQNCPVCGISGDTLT
jgi:hypothetical protein